MCQGVIASNKAEKKLREIFLVSKFVSKNSRGTATVPATADGSLTAYSFSPNIFTNRDVIYIYGEFIITKRFKI